MIKNSKKHAAVILALTLVLGTVLTGIPVHGEDTNAATESEEVIYASLDPDGVIKNAYSVVILNAAGSKPLSYYGSFDEIKNLTDSSELSYENGKLSTQTASGDFYFQGNLKNPQLPWRIAVSYELDGRSVDARELSGASGKLKITIKTSANEGIGTEFFENYMLQTSLTLDTELCKNITAEGATIASAGSSKMINFVVLPGTEGELSLSADVKDFHMGGISIAAVPYDISDAMGDVSELTNGLNGLSSGVSQLTKGIAGLSGGIAGLSTGAAALENGVQSYGSGMTQLSASSDSIVGASSQIYEALKQINGGLSGESGGETGGAGIAALVQLPDGLQRLAAALDEVRDGLNRLTAGFDAAYSAMSSAVAAIPAPLVSESDIAALMAANPENQALAALIENYSAAQTVRGTWQQASQAFEGVSKSLPTISGSVETVSGALKHMAEQFEEAIKSSESLSGLAELTSGMAELLKSYGSFHEGLTSYAGGVKALAGNWGSIEKGVSELSDGAGALNGGAQEITRGANTLNREVQGIPGRVNELIGNVNKGKFKPVSFLSDKNENCKSVQFVISTEGIEKPAPSDDAHNKVSTNTLWDRLKALFT